MIARKKVRLMSFTRKQYFPNDFSASVGRSSFKRANFFITFARRRPAHFVLLITEREIVFYTFSALVLFTFFTSAKLLGIQSKSNSSFAGCHGTGRELRCTSASRFIERNLINAASRFDFEARAADPISRAL